MKKVANDPNYIVEFAVGTPSPSFQPQRRGTGLTLTKVYYDHTKRYLMKSARFSVEDMRIFDMETGQVVLVSHHPGKNPYEALDPTGITESAYSVAGGEWESKCDVTAIREDFANLKIRPKWISRHGRQTIATADDENVVMSIGKVSKLKSMSMRSQFMVSEGESKTLRYKCVADVVGRSVDIFNEDDQLVAQIAKTTKALMRTAVFGSGSESTIDVAPGVDCSVILAIVFGLKQVGKHCTFFCFCFCFRLFSFVFYATLRSDMLLTCLLFWIVFVYFVVVINDALGNYVKDPITDMAADSAVDSVMDGIGGGDEEEGDDEGGVGETIGTLFDALFGGEE